MGSWVPSSAVASRQSFMLGTALRAWCARSRATQMLDSILEPFFPPNGLCARFRGIQDRPRVEFLPVGMEIFCTDTMAQIAAWHTTIRGLQTLDQQQDCKTGSSCAARTKANAHTWMASMLPLQIATALPATSISVSTTRQTVAAVTVSAPTGPSLK